MWSSIIAHPFLFFKIVLLPGRANAKSRGSAPHPIFSAGCGGFAAATSGKKTFLGGLRPPQPPPAERCISPDRRVCMVAAEARLC
jgi:hypothetical protein